MGCAASSNSVASGNNGNGDMYSAASPKPAPRGNAAVSGAVVKPPPTESTDPAKPDIEYAVREAQDFQILRAQADQNKRELQEEKRRESNDQTTLLQQLPLQQETKAKPLETIPGSPAMSTQVAHPSPSSHQSSHLTVQKHPLQSPSLSTSTLDANPVVIERPASAAAANKPTSNP